MLHIAICDNEKLICDQMESFMDRCRQEKNIVIDSFCFLSGEALSDVLEKGDSFDLIFLDIEMYHLSGIDIAKMIRECCNDHLTQIVYISGKQEYAMELFETHPLNFLLKPLSYEGVVSCIEKTLSLKTTRGELFTYTANGHLVRVPLANILYFESMNRKIRIVRVGMEDEFYGKLGEVEGQYCEKGFVRIHKSFIVNLGYIESFSHTEIVMSNGHRLPLSRDKRKVIADALLRSRFGEDDL